MTRLKRPRTAKRTKLQATTWDIINMKRLTIKSAIAFSCALGSAALAGDPHSGGMTGQPNQSCQNPATMTTPGNAAFARGSAFNTAGVAGAVYANPTSQGGVSSGNTHVVAQYDVACFQQQNRVNKQAGGRH
jgi:hypothetical protein